MTTQPPKPPIPSQPFRGPRVVVKKVDPSIAEKAKERKKQGYAMWGLAAVALGVVGWAAWSVLGIGGWFQSPPPDPNELSGKDLAAYLASDKFASLPDAMKDDYSSRVQKITADKGRGFVDTEGMTRQDRDKVRGAVSRAWRKQMMDSIHDYFKLSPEDRPAELDKRLTDPNRRGPFGGGGPRSGDPSAKSGSGGPPSGSTGTGGNSPRGPRQPPSPDQYQRRTEARLDGTTPEDRAYMTEYFRQLRQRAQQLQAPKK